MRKIQMCERCEGTGADPVQHLVDDEVRLCVECYGEGCVELFADRSAALLDEIERALAGAGARDALPGGAGERSARQRLTA
jgi:hypothetical protein